MRVGQAVDDPIEDPSGEHTKNVKNPQASNHQAGIFSARLVIVSAW